MNELYGVDPEIIKSVSDLRSILNYFGPYTGRYLVNYPVDSPDWMARLNANLANLSDLQIARAKRLLSQANTDLRMVRKDGLPWRVTRDWLENAEPLMNAGILDGLIAKESRPPAIHDFDDFEISTTSEERIIGCGEEYARVSEILLFYSQEVALVDPYMDPVKSKYESVLERLLKKAAQRRTKKKFIFWARASAVFSNGETDQLYADLERQLNKLLKKSGLEPGSSIEMNLVEDKGGINTMHGRYLLSRKGGIRFDQGFQRLSVGIKTDVSPIGKKTHDELLEIYFDGSHDMKIIRHICANLM
ncbi:hypothetical protein [Xenophilus sp. Marseille-Q4582]|uniref:hypothetical protein n=1 Tax=Xenophilus sp. Marseille-Q4582 TaxID=2866600 RepID=UPI001CE48A6E|nr:hypothetical protein [Xenophilus sp. Marseille-Q4582]